MYGDNDGHELCMQRLVQASLVMATASMIEQCEDDDEYDDDIVNVWEEPMPAYSSLWRRLRLDG